MKWLAVALFLAAPFWETKTPREWTEQELETLLTDSPWAAMVAAPGDAPPVQVYLASAGPMQQAEAERIRRQPRNGAKPPTDMDLEYQAWMRENRATSIVVAIAILRLNDGQLEEESQRMQDESVMRIGRKKFKMTGYFPPTAGDPYLRLAFPRKVAEADKNVRFDLYIPGAPMPYRSIEFKIRDMMVNGRLEI